MILVGYSRQGVSGGTLAFESHDVDASPGTTFTLTASAAGTYVVGLAGAWDAAPAFVTLDGVAITPLHSANDGSDYILFGSVTLASGGSKTLVITDPTGSNYRACAGLWRADGLDLSAPDVYSRDSTEVAVSTATYNGGARVWMMLNQDLDPQSIVGLDTVDIAQTNFELSFIVIAASQNDTANGTANVSLDGDGSTGRLLGAGLSIPPA